MDKNTFYSVISGLCGLNNLDRKRYKIIDIFVIINFMLENFINVEKNDKLFNFAGEKLKLFKQDPELELYIDEFNIDYERWIEIFNQ